MPQKDNAPPVRTESAMKNVLTIPTESAVQSNNVEKHKSHIPLSVTAPDSITMQRPQNPALMDHKHSPDSAPGSANTMLWKSNDAYFNSSGQLDLTDSPELKQANQSSILESSIQYPIMYNKDLPPSKFAAGDQVLRTGMQFRQTVKSTPENGSLEREVSKTDADLNSSSFQNHRPVVVDNEFGTVSPQQDHHGMPGADRPSSVSRMRPTPSMFLDKPMDTAEKNRSNGRISPRVMEQALDASDDISDISDGGSSSLFSNSSDTLLLNRMNQMQRRCARMKSLDEGYKSANFIVQNVQFLDKDKQISFCQVAIKTLRRLNQLGHADSSVALGHMYVRGIPGFQNGHKADYVKAFQCYASSAKKDHVEGSFHLALCYEHGLGSQVSNSRAFQWYRKAAVGYVFLSNYGSNHPGAMFRMSSALLKGELGQQIDSRDGLKWLRLAAKYANEQYPQALYELAILHDEGLKSLVWPDHKYMIELLTHASELQHAPSQYILGQAYEYGRYSVDKDPAKSIFFYSLAASNNHVEVGFAFFL